MKTTKQKIREILEFGSVKIRLDKCKSLTLSDGGDESQFIAQIGTNFNKDIWYSIYPITYENSNAILAGEEIEGTFNDEELENVLEDLEKNKR